MHYSNLNSSATNTSNGSSSLSRKNSNESNNLMSKIVPQTTVSSGPTHHLMHHKSKIKELKTTGPKKQQFAASLNEKNKKDKPSSGVSTVFASGLTESSLFSSLSAMNNGCTFTSSMNKLLSLKRSRKRSKMLLTNASSISSSNGIQQISSGSTNNSNKANSILESVDNDGNGLKSSQCKKLSIIKQNKFNLNAANIPLLAKTNTKKSDKKAEKLKHQLKKTSSTSANSNTIGSAVNNPEYLINSIRLNSNFEPLTKKLAVASTSDASLKLFFGASNSKDTNNNSKKDEVDLDIKELSLLDLHSSEDDSNEIFLK